MIDTTARRAMSLRMPPTLAMSQRLERRFPSQAGEVVVGLQVLAHPRLALQCLSQPVERGLAVAVHGLPATQLVIDARALRPRFETVLEQLARGFGIGLLHVGGAERPLPCR